jgi:hypothetical protein
MGNATLSTKVGGAEQAQSVVPTEDGGIQLRWPKLGCCYSAARDSRSHCILARVFNRTLATASAAILSNTYGSLRTDPVFFFPFFCMHSLRNVVT